MPSLVTDAGATNRGVSIGLASFQIYRRVVLSVIVQDSCRRRGSGGAGARVPSGCPRERSFSLTRGGVAATSERKKNSLEGFALQPPNGVAPEEYEQRAAPYKSQ